VWGSKSAGQFWAAQQTLLIASQMIPAHKAGVETAWEALPVNILVWNTIHTDLNSQAFLIAMKQMSQSKTPLVHNVIPIIDIIAWVVDNYSSDTALPPAMHMATLRGRTMPNKYYGLTDESIVYHITMCKSIIPTH
jgi:hypothetical protein